MSNVNPRKIEKTKNERHHSQLRALMLVNRCNKPEYVPKNGEDMSHDADDDGLRHNSNPTVLVIMSCGP